MAAIHQVSPATLFLIQGMGQADYPGAGWGNGFVTNSSLIKQYRLSDANVFSQALTDMPFLNNVIISPHMFPPSITYTTQAQTGAALWAQVYSSFGYLQETRYEGHKFPIVLGETGSTFASAVDNATMEDLSLWLQGHDHTGPKHKAVQGLAWNSWSPNATAAGGLTDAVTWSAINWVKVGWLQKTIELQPWYAAAQAPASQASAPAAAPPSGASPSSPSPTAGQSSRPAQKPAVAAGPAPQSASAPVRCSVTVQVSMQQWGSAPSFYNTVNAMVRNLGTAAVKTTWKLSLGSPAYKFVQQSWNWDVTVRAEGLVGTAAHEWEGWGAVMGHGRGGRPVSRLCPRSSSTQWQPLPAACGDIICWLIMLTPGIRI